MKTEQCFCKSYSDDDHKIQDCTCGKCDTQEIQEWQESFDSEFSGYEHNKLIHLNDKLKSFISQKLKEQEERHKREIESIRKAFIEEFFGSGERWYNYVFENEEEKLSALKEVEYEWEEILKHTK